MTQPANVTQTPADTYLAAFSNVLTIDGMNAPKLIRLGELCVGLAVRRFEQFVTERDELFTELFGQRSEELQELGRVYMFEAGRFGRCSHQR